MAESEGPNYGQPEKFEFPRTFLSESSKFSWLGMNQSRGSNEKVLCQLDRNVRKGRENKKRRQKMEAHHVKVHRKAHIKTINGISDD